MKTTIRLIVLVAVATVVSISLKAQSENKIQFKAGADLVSSYVWRGMYQTGVSFQPTLSASLSGFTLGAWGSTDFSTMAKEMDLFFTYSYNGLTLGVTDYWWSGQGAKYFDYKSKHYLEGTLGYSFGEKFPLSVTWNTMFAFDSDKSEQGKQMYSTYINLDYQFKVNDVNLTAGVGITPWKGIYSDKFDVMAISLKGAKEIPVTDKFSLPLFVQAIAAPARNDFFLVIGLSL